MGIHVRGPIRVTREQGREFVITIGQSELAIVDHYVRKDVRRTIVFNSGNFRGTFPLLGGGDEFYEYTILSLANQVQSHRREFRRRIHTTQNQFIDVIINARVEYRLNPSSAERNLDKFITEHNLSFAQIETKLVDSLFNVFEEVINHTHWFILQQEKRLLEDRIIDYLDREYNTRLNLMLDVVNLQIDDISLLGQPNPPPKPPANFIKFSGPNELAPNWDSYNLDGYSTPMFYLNTDEFAFIEINDGMSKGKLKSMASGQYPLSRDSELAHPNTIIHIFIDGLQERVSLDDTVQILIKNSLVDVGMSGTITYRIVPSLMIELINTTSVAIQSLDTFIEDFKQQFINACAELVDREWVTLLRFRSQLNKKLNEMLQASQPFRKSGILVVQADLRLRFPPNIMENWLTPVDDNQVVAQLQVANFMPNTRMIKAPDNQYMILKLPQGGVEVLRPGQTQALGRGRISGLQPEDTVILVNREQWVVSVDHEFMPKIPLSNDLVQLGVSASLTAYLTVDLQALRDAQRSDDVIDGLNRIAGRNDSEWLQRILIECFEQSVEDEIIAVLNKNTRAVSNASTMFLEQRLRSYGFKVERLQVNKLKYADELDQIVFAKHRSYIALLETMSDLRLQMLTSLAAAEEKKRWSEILPPFNISMLMNDPETLVPLLQDTIRGAQGIAETSGSGQEVMTYLSSMLGLLDQRGGQQQKPHHASNSYTAPNSNQTVNDMLGQIQSLPDTVDTIMQDIRNTTDDTIDDIYVQVDDDAISLDEGTMSRPSMTSLPEGDLVSTSTQSSRETQNNLSQHIKRQIKEILMLEEVKGCIQSTDSTITVTLTCDDASDVFVRFQLSDTYPQTAPEITKLRFKDSNDNRIKGDISLQTLAMWSMGNYSIMDIVEEIIDEGVQIFDD